MCLHPYLRLGRQAQQGCQHGIELRLVVVKRRVGRWAAGVRVDWVSLGLVPGPWQTGLGVSLVVGASWWLGVFAYVSQVVQKVLEALESKVGVGGEGFSGLDPEVVIVVMYAVDLLRWWSVCGYLMCWSWGIVWWCELICIVLKHVCSIAEGSR
jgi:hypothetical protein